MSQVDYVIANDTHTALRADLNATLLAIASNNSGATEPTTTYSYQWWSDTTTGILKMRNAANSAWISMFTIATGAWLGPVSTTSVTSTGAISSSSASAGIGYSTGAGGTVTQLTSKSTAVTFESRCGVITMHNAALAGGASVKFTINRTTLGYEHATVSVASAMVSNYSVRASSVYFGGVDIVVTNTTAGSLSDAVPIGINFTNFVSS